MSKKKLKIKVQDNSYQPVALKPFKLTKKNVENYEVINNIILKKNRITHFIVVNDKGIILNIEGYTNLTKKIGDNIYE